MRLRLCIMVLVGMICLCGCNLGVRGLTQDYPAFSDTIRQLEDEQLLTNLLRIRYQETPIFLEIGSITTSYGVSASTNIAGTVGTGGAGSATAGAGTGYSEAPTIAYSIPDSKKLYGAILAPLSANKVTSVSRSGPGIVQMLRICAKRINRLENINLYGSWEPLKPASYRDFEEMLILLERLWETGAVDFATGPRYLIASGPFEVIDSTEAIPQAETIGMQFRKDDDGKFKAWRSEKYLHLRFHAASEGSPDVKRLRELLGLSNDRSSFAIIDAHASGDEKKRLFGSKRAAAMDPSAEFHEMVLVNRSLYEILVYASLYIDVPVAHIDAGLTRPKSDSFREQLAIQHSLEEPESAAIKVRFKGYWFYVAANDLGTKDVISLLNTLFAATAGTVPGPQPVLTQPVK